MNTEQIVQIIQEEVSREYNISILEIQSKKRNREILIPRQIIQAMICRKTTLTQKQIGVLIGDCNHATISHSIITISNLLDTDILFNKTYYGILDKVEKRIGNFVELTRIDKTHYLQNTIDSFSELEFYSKNNRKVYNKTLGIRSAVEIVNMKAIDVFNMLSNKSLFYVLTLT